MIAKMLAGAVALVLSNPAAPTVTHFESATGVLTSGEQPELIFQNYPLVRRVDCRGGSGTAFRANGQWVSVDHVTSLSSCSVGGQPIKVVEGDWFNDFSRFNVASSVANEFEIDCGGFIPGHWYWAIGHAYGQPFQTAIALYAKADIHITGMRILVSMNLLIPGMSGGPIVDPATGKVVGTVNARNDEHQLNFSRELKDTSLCRNSVGGTRSPGA